MRIRFINAIASAFGALARWAEDVERSLRLCPNCGRNQYYGKPCQGEWERP